MTLEELKQFDGREGNAAYIAYRGKVYDVTESPLWQDGDHEGLHSAGQDLTAAMADAPHSEEVFSRYPVVGALETGSRASVAAVKKDAAAAARKTRLQAWYRQFHPHPMTVHFPIALHLFAAGADLLFFASPKAAYATAVFYTFFVATAMGLVAMVPGILSWWINYGLSMRRPFVVKIAVSVLMLLLGIVGIAIYLENPSVVYEGTPAAFIYHAIVLLTGAGVIVLGYYGGKITWGDTSATESSQNTPSQPPQAKPVQEAADPDTALLQPAGRYEPADTVSPDASPVALPEHASQTPSPRQGRSLAVLIGGAAGQGIDTLESVLADAFRRSGFYVFASKEFMSRVRGGSNTVLIRVSDTPIEAACWQVDLYIALDKAALAHAAPRFSDKTVILADEAFAQAYPGAIALPLQRKARELGDIRYANTFAAGVVYGLLGLDASRLQESVAERFGESTGNAQAVSAGAGAGEALGHPPLPPLPDPADGARALHLMDGTTACGFGFLAGGCNFVASYPMSPSTGVLNFMAAMSKQFDIAVEQSEDEIASIHMMMGAWYAGGRALATTSGGGFALMGEGISLSGITETPAVVYLAQRPGPATGMPTRSEQGDLNLALHSGHGPFARILLAPGSLRECVDMGYLAFELADRWQVPVILLSDQYLADSTAMIGDIDFASFEPRRYVVRTEASYRRYEDAPGGVSPRAVPAYGDGLLCTDGHEHDERGQITEDFKMREQMVAKRARKAEGVAAEALPPEVSGEGTIAVIGWGSTKGALTEALRRLDDDRLVQVHFAWVHPLNPDQLAFLKKYDRRIVVENNADGAFADRLVLHGLTVERKVLQSNGFAFFADQLAEKLQTVIKELT